MHGTVVEAEVEVGLPWLVRWWVVNGERVVVVVRSVRVRVSVGGKGGGVRVSGDLGEKLR